MLLLSDIINYMEKLNKLKNFYNKYVGINLKELIFLIIFVCFCFYDTGYMIYKPGGIVNVDTRITGNNLYESSGTFNMAYVSAIKGKAPIYLIAKLMPNWELVKNSDVIIDNETMEDVEIQDRLDYQKAIVDAKYVALKKAGVDFNLDKEVFYIYYLTKENTSDLKVGDEIISYDNILFKDLNTFKEYVSNKNINDEIKIKYKRKNNEYETSAKIYEKDNGKYIGISVVSLLDVSSKYNLEIKNKNSESGPSGGLIMSLSMYNALTSEDITKGKKIVGTGTIDRNGNVGAIGGINYKLASAVKEKADLFICPVDNYDEVKELMDKYNYKIKVISVSTFDETIRKLEQVFA